MTLDEGFRQQGKPFLITGSSRNELPAFLVSQGYKVGAEIGVYRGEYTEKFCKAGLKMFAVDQWQAFRGQGRTQQSQEKQADAFWEARTRLSPYGCQIIKASSMAALDKFRNRSLDFVYIDADHSLPHVINDIWYWSAKVRQGGIIAGHDYFCSGVGSRNTVVHVEPAVKAYVEVMGIPNYWVFGGNKRRGDMDHCYSFMWVRP